MLNERTEDNIVIAEFDYTNFNTITIETLRQLSSIVKKVNSQDELKGIILTGKGKVFCSGFHLPMFVGFETHEEVVEFFKEEEEILLELFNCKKPVVSAINGAAMAGGLIKAMAGDYRIVKNHPKIKIGMSEIKIGLALSITQNEVMRFGLDSDKKYRDVMYFGKQYSVDEALEMGLVDEIVEDENLIPRAKEVITSWIDNPGRAFIQMKELLRAPASERISNYMETKDWQEGLRLLTHPDTKKTLQTVAKMMGM